MARRNHPKPSALKLHHEFHTLSLKSSYERDPVSFGVTTSGFTIQTDKCSLGFAWLIGKGIVMHSTAPGVRNTSVWVGMVVVILFSCSCSGSSSNNNSLAVAEPSS